LRYAKAIVRYSYIPHGQQVTPRDISRLTDDVCSQATKDLRELRCLDPPRYIVPVTSTSKSKGHLHQNTQWRCATALDLPVD